jgi:exodeoxyribonuclease VII small subunit
LVPRKREINFEQAVQELEGLVECMEKGELGLEESLKAFERGVELTRLCQKALDEAEQKVDILTRKEDGLQPQPMEPETDE